jgi:hypothetical protein
MADNFGGGENIYFESLDNIVIIDPNSVVDSSGKKSDRVIKQENLVMYANLEANTVPRTILAEGKGVNNVQLASINFLKPQDKNYFDTSYTEQLTGGQNSQGGINQLSFDSNQNPQQTNYVDTQLLGIKSINVDIKFNGIPEVTMSLVDVQGRSLFETGGNSPYSVFLYYPYPLFRLTLKGYYGKAIEYELMLLNFNATFEASTGNYIVDLKFIARTSAILEDIRLGYLLALPNMYPNSELPQTTQSDTPSSATASVQQIGQGVTQDQIVNINSKGYNKLKQVFQEYKNKGLIDKNVPVLSLNEMSINLEKYVQFLNEQFEKLDFRKIVALTRYQESVNKFAGEISQWFTTYTDVTDVIVLKEDSGGFVLQGLKNIVLVTNDGNGDKNTQSNLEKENIANSKLTGIITKYEKELKSVPYWGTNIPVGNDTFKLNFYQENFSEKNIDFEATYLKQGGELSSVEGRERFTSFKRNLIQSLKRKGTLISVINSGITETVKENSYYYTADKINKKLNEINGVVNQKGDEENEILKKKLEESVITNNNTTNLTFRPTIRNVIGTIMASVDAFYRLLSDVHFNAWNQRQNPYRLRSIINDTPSQEGKDSVQSANFQNQTKVVYPWPQFVQKKEQSGKSEYEVTYPNAKSATNATRGFDPQVWPEVEFVEQYLYGAIQKEKNFNSNVLPNPKIVLKYTPGGALEFVFNDTIYNDTGVIEFMYEFYERLLTNVFYSGLYYTETSEDLQYMGSQIELNNIRAKNIPSGDLANVILNDLTTQSLYQYLGTTAGSQKEGPLWNNFREQQFNTQYIKTKVDENFNVYSTKQYNNLSKKPVNLTALDNLKKFLKNATSGQETIFDTFPFVTTQGKTYLESQDVEIPITNILQTVETLNVDDSSLLINNFSGKRISLLTKTKNAITGFTGNQINHTIVNDFYKSRYNNSANRVLTEGNISYTTESSLITTQTTSILNTPYFINAIIEAAESTDSERFTKLSYLFLNSLPLSTLYERYLDVDGGKKSDYIFATLNKFGAIHKLPYPWILKIGSIWYRYKKKVQNNVDILDSVWKDFDYRGAYDPTSNSLSREYDIIIDNNTTRTKFKIDDNNSLRVGFYPKVVNSFYKIFTGYDLFNDYDLSTKPDSFYTNNLRIINQTPNTNIKGPLKSYFTYFNIDQTYAPYFGQGDYLNKSLVIPSGGYSPFYQSYYELTTQDDFEITKDSLIGNPNMYNGSVQSMWGIPNYGWFNTEGVVKPDYNQYLKYIRNDKTQQTEFDLDGGKYSSIEDLFGVFTKEQLDFFEGEFIEFSKQDGQSSIFKDSTEIPVEFSNIVELLKNCFIIDKPTSFESLNISQTLITDFTDIINKFLNIDVYLKIGNPKKYDRYHFGSFQTNSELRPQTLPIYGVYVSGSTPDGTISFNDWLSDSNNKTLYNELLLNVGFSTIDDIKYGDRSTIFDFFIDNNIEFNSTNIKSLSQLIRIYSTQKNKNKSYNNSQFVSNLTQTFSNALIKKNTIEGQIRGKLATNLKLPPIPETTTPNKVNGDVIKLDTWELFKSINDKWVAGQNFNEFTLFEQFLFFDKSNRDIGDEILVDVETIRKYCSWDNANNSIMFLIRQILSVNKFNFFVMPAYINFYGKPTASTTNRNETILNNANDVFSTFTYVDTTASSPKFLCQYVDRPSQTLSMENDSNYPYKSDSFDLGNSAGNPIRNTNQVPTTQQFKNNKAVGFVVDFGVQNQNIFKSIEITQNQSVASSEQIQINIDLGLQGSGKKVAQQSTALYEFYKSRSYDCTIKTIGNVMIQPTMYFIVRHMPMFNGTYIVRSVKHSITPGQFTTQIDGQRISSTINAKVRDELASVNDDFTKKLNNRVKTLVQNNQLVTFNSATNEYIQNEQDRKTYVITGRTPYQGGIVLSQDSPTQECLENVFENYKLERKDFSSQNVSISNLAALLKQNISNESLRLYMFTMLYLEGYKMIKDVTYKQNNLYGVTTDVNWGGLAGTDGNNLGGFRCLTSTKGTIPFASFNKMDDSILFVRDFYENKFPTYSNSNDNDILCLKSDTYNVKSLNSIECTSNLFIKIYYNTWYTSGGEPKTLTEISKLPEYNTWLGLVKNAITKGLQPGFVLF